MIPQETIDKILSAARIEEVIADFITLKKKGSGYTACCPFHDEKTPSFFVNPAKGFYKCFGCGKGGNVVSFLEEIEKHNFPDAIKWLGNKYNIEIPADTYSGDNKEYSSKINSLKELNEFASSYFQQHLPKSPAVQFLKDRGITGEVAREFSIGFHPNDFSKFSSAAVKNGVSDGLLVESGLVYNKDDKKYDFFKGRVIYPIHHHQYGYVIGFAGRTLLDKNQLTEYYKVNKVNIPKFINSPESPIYVKSQSLYNFHRAKHHIVKENEAILVEGYHDVISLWMGEVKHSVSPCGTALTEDQLKMIRRFTKNITLFFDGDEAGKKAIIHSIEKALPLDFNVFVCPLSSGDPDTFAREHQSDLNARIEGMKIHWLTYIFNRYIRNAEDVTVKTEWVNKAISLINLIPDPIESDEAVRELSKLTGTKLELLAKKVNVNISGEMKEGDLFAWNEAKSSIKAENECIISASKETVIDNHLNNITNCVGFLNTISDEKINELGKLSKHIVFCDNISKDEKVFFDGKTHQEYPFFVLCKKLIALGFNVSVNHTVNDIEKQDNFIDFYIKELVENINFNDRKTKNIAIERSAEILSFLNDTDRLSTIDFIFTTFKKRDIKFSKAAFQKITDDYLKRNKTGINKKEVTIQIDNPMNLSEEQIQTLNEYHLYFHKNQMWFVAKEMGHTTYSNFIIEPILHTISTNDVSKIFKMTNFAGATSMLSITPDVLNSVEKFCSKCEEKGNFRFDGAKNELKRLKHYLMDHTVYSTEIEELGWQRNGFWAWADGVSTVSGDFIPIDEYGLVTVDMSSYYLKPFSKLYIEDKTVFVNERNFRHITGKITFGEFCKQYTLVFGEKSWLSIMGYLTTLFSDFIFNRISKVPLFNFFGPKGTGKTEQAIALQHFFGDRPDTINISSSTLYAAAHMLRVFKNAITVIDEYKNSIGIDRIEFLKSIYNRQGRLRGTLNKDGVKVEKIPVNSIVFLCGQQMPTADVALLSRCIFMSNYKDQYSAEEKQRFNNFQDLCRDGLTHITDQLITNRELIEESWEENFHELESIFKEKLQDTDTRLIENHSIMLATFLTLSKAGKIDIGVTIETLISLSVSSIVEQMNIIKTSNEMFNFWSIMVYMLEKGIISEGNNFRIEKETFIELKYDSDKEQEVKTYKFVEAKDILYLRWDGIYQMFSKVARETAMAEILPERSLLYYIEHSHAYMGKLKSMRFTRVDPLTNEHSSTINQAWAFNYDLLNINMKRNNASSFDEYKPSEGTFVSDGNEIPF